MPPEVKVRLSVEGTPEALAAFKAVQAQAQATGKASGKAFAPLSGALSGIKGLLASAAAAFSVGALLSFGKQALDNVDKLRHLAEALGTTVEHLSGLSVAATLADSDLEMLSTTMGILAKNVDALKNKSPAATAAFARLRLTAKDFPGEDTSVWFETVARRLNEMEKGGTKTAIAIALMGRNGKAALPIMKELGELGGLQGAEARARAMGVFVDATTLVLIEQLTSSMKILKMEATGAALQFSEGFGPSAVQTMGALSASTDGTANSFRGLGEMLGWILGSIVPLINIFDQVAMNLATWGLSQAASITALWLAVSGRGEEARALLDRLKSELRVMDEEVATRIAARNAGMKAPPLPAVKGDSERDKIKAAADAAATARAKAAFEAALALQKQAVEDELALALQGIKHQEEAAKRSYETGKSSLEEYYTKRRQIAEKAVSAEIDALDKEWRLSAKEQDPNKRAAEQARITAKATSLGAGFTDQLNQLGAEQSDAEAKLARERLKFEQEYLTAQGHTHAAEMADLAEKVAAYQEWWDAADAEMRKGMPTPAAFGAALGKSKTDILTMKDIADAAGNALGSWLGSSINQVKSLGEAFRSLGLSIASAIQQLVGMTIAKKLLGFMGFSEGGAVQRRAGGGRVYGAGTSTSDSIAAFLSAGEYVLRASSVTSPGMLPFLEAANRLDPAALQLARSFGPQMQLRDPAGESLRRMAEGGIVQAHSATANLAGELTFVLPPGVELQINAPENVRQLIKVVHEHKRAFNKVLE